MNPDGRLKGLWQDLDPEFSVADDSLHTDFAMCTIQDGQLHAFGCWASQHMHLARPKCQAQCLLWAKGETCWRGHADLAPELIMAAKFSVAAASLHSGFAPWITAEWASA